MLVNDDGDNDDGEDNDENKNFNGSCNILFLQLDVEVEKKVVFWITVPCVEHIGSCNYPDACPLLEKLNCPPVFEKYGIPCKCPIAAVRSNSQLHHFVS